MKIFLIATVSFWIGFGFHALLTTDEVKTPVEQTVEVPSEDSEFHPKEIEIVQIVSTMQYQAVSADKPLFDAFRDIAQKCIFIHLGTNKADKRTCDKLISPTMKRLNGEAATIRLQKVIDNRAVNQ